MKKFIILPVIACLALPSRADKIWTLQQCIDYALANNITLQQNKVSSAQSDIEISSAKALLLPSVSASTSQAVAYRPYSQSTINLTNGTMTSTQSATNYNGSYGINANWTVWNGNQNYNNIKKSEMNKQLADLQTEETANSIQQQIAQLYFQILYEKEAVKVDSEIVKASRLQCDRAKEMYKVGSLAKVDVAQLEAQVTQDEYSLVSAKSQLESYKLQLKQLLEIHGSEELDVVAPSLTDATVLKAIPSKEAIYATALDIRPEVQSGKLSIDAAKLDEKIAKAGYYPTVSMNAGIGSSNASGMHTAFGTQLKNNWSNSIGLSISVPRFDQKQTKSAVKKARLATQNSQLQLEGTQKQLYSEIENYWLNAMSSQQQYRSAKSNVESMKESYDLVSEQFRLGLKNIVELTTGKNNLLSAQQQMLQSKYTALYNISMLYFYEGQGVSL